MRAPRRDLLPLIRRLERLRRFCSREQTSVTCMDIADREHGGAPVREGSEGPGRARWERAAGAGGLLNPERHRAPVAYRLRDGARPPSTRPGSGPCGARARADRMGLVSGLVAGIAVVASRRSRRRDQDATRTEDLGRGGTNDKSSVELVESQRVAEVRADSQADDVSDAE